MEIDSVGMAEIMIVIEIEGWCSRICFPSSTIENKWPLPGDGYKTMVSSMRQASLFSHNHRKRER
jgi:hypothetical protein